MKSALNAKMDQDNKMVIDMEKMREARIQKGIKAFVNKFFKFIFQQVIFLTGNTMRITVMILIIQSIDY